jgi:hypothetical protein
LLQSTADHLELASPDRADLVDQQQLDVSKLSHEVVQRLTSQIFLAHSETAGPDPLHIYPEPPRIHKH